MRALLLTFLVFAASAQAALLEDPTGDVVINHCETADTPASGFDAMDLVELTGEETPSEITFRVKAAGLTDEAEYDSGNYFVHFKRGEQHYALRMFQDNAGTGAIAHLIQTDTVSLFGPVIAELAANVDGDEQTIETAIPRGLLLDHDGSPPIRGQTIDQILVSAEAHATGAYFCSFDGSGGGPAIIRDLMPDDFVDGASMEIQYGGGTFTGPVNGSITRPFRASNGEATVYAFEVAVENLDTVAHNYTFDTEMPDGWVLHRPNGTFQIPPAHSGVFTAYLQVPFEHQHGVTRTGKLLIASLDGTSEGEVDFGVHFVDPPQPAGHHRMVYLHSVPPLGAFTEIKSGMGAGDNEMFFNTIEDDDADHGLPMSSQTVDGDHVWYGCLAPGLIMGLSPDGNATGTFDLAFTSDVAITGTLSGKIGVVTPEQRGSTCHEARAWEATPFLELSEVPLTVDGSGSATGEIVAVAQNDIPYEPGMDLLLEIRLSPDETFPVGGVVDLEPGGQMELPVLDYHEPVPEIDIEEGEGFVPDEEPPTKKSPMPLALVAAALLVALRRR